MRLVEPDAKGQFADVGADLLAEIRAVRLMNMILGRQKGIRGGI